MYLKKIELQGFKSFADKTALEFMPGVTVVIGPNGSGKSNISDAIRWVLGEQSMKSLRSAKSEDVIFAGTQSRKGLGFAETSIIIDNSDARLPIEFAEVVVTRRLYRSGESEYFINKTSCRLKDILELFMDTGIGKDGYSIIGQGKIDSILSNNSQDRRHIFEEAAGIVKYRVRKIESEKKLEQTKVNLIRINDILSEIESNLDPLKESSEKAKKFLGLREELKGIEVGLFLYNIDKYKEKLEEIAKDEELLISQTCEEEKQQEELIEVKNTIKQELESLILEIDTMQNIGFESSNKIEKLNSEIGIADGKIESNEENYERLLSEIEEIELKNVSLEEEKTTRLDKKEKMFLNLEKFTNELKEKEAEFNELNSKLSNEELKIESKKQELEQLEDKKLEVKSEINLKSLIIENLVKREMTVKNEIEENISELDAARISKEDFLKTFGAIENSRNSILCKLENIESKKQESNLQLKKYDEEINKMTEEYRIKDSRRKFLVETEKEKEGYNRAVKTLLLDCEKNSLLGKGVHGALASLISVPTEYETAVEMCLGASLQNIVTDTEEEAKRLVEYLKKNNLGRASFLPIAAVKGKKLDINVKRYDGVIGMASDLIDYDKKYEQIVLNLLGRTVIVNNMDTAILLSKQNSYSFRIVTVGGDIVNPSGLITGGSTNAKTTSILGRGREIEKLEATLKEITANLEKLKKEKENYIDSIKNILEEADKLETELKEIDITYATEKQKLISLEDNVEKQNNRLKKLRTEIGEISNSKSETIKDKEQSEEIVVDLDVKINELDKEITEFSDKNKEHQEYINSLNLDITNLKISISSFDESGASIDEFIQRIEEDILNNKTNIENKKIQRENILKENTSLQENINLIKQEISKIEDDVKNSGSKILELKEKRVEQNKKLDEIEESITNSFKIIEGLKEQVGKINIKKTKLESDIEQIVNKMWEEYELTPNNASEYKRPENVSLATKEVNDLREQIKVLGSINVDSIEEYKKTKERYDFMSEQRNDLESSANKLRNVINEMTEIMREQFGAQFKLINKNFGEVFSELFGGGRAEIKIADESNILESGIEIDAEPPGKKLQNIMLLSGGEKALTAIALLFAILKLNPAPFCVLDEIEAALDDVNVYRFAEYLRKFSKATQFLVITHRKGTMEAADTVYGITMQENGISKLLSMKLGK